MSDQPMVELWRGGHLESVHRGHAVICDAAGIVEAWGAPETLIFPRSSCKMIQALPLMESGAADEAGLGTRQLALACASHSGGRIHVEGVSEWLDTVGLGEPDLRCGSHRPRDFDEQVRLIQHDAQPCQLHNNCSGKHAGFLTFNRHLGARPDYHEVDHPVQLAVREAFEEVTGRASPGFGIDGCSAPNFMCRLQDLAHAMAAFADPAAAGIKGVRADAMERLVAAMAAHPELVGGKGRACTELMAASRKGVAVKVGAEAVYCGIVPAHAQPDGRALGIALKITDGGVRAAEAAVAALMVRLGVLEAENAAAQTWIDQPQINCNGINTGELRLAGGFAGR